MTSPKRSSLRRFHLKYALPKLPYALDALEPHIDERTMRFHYLGHHKAYVDKLNKIMKDHPRYARKVEQLLTSLDKLPKKIQTEVRNSAGGHANHSLFWSLLTPKEEILAEGDFSVALNNSFGNVATFKERFAELAMGHFSNGWAWLCASPGQGLKLLTTKDHESPLTQGLTPLLVLDLWEHAYYLKHQNRREEYISSFWKVVNWTEVAGRWNEFQVGGESSREWRLAG